MGRRRDVPRLLQQDGGDRGDAAHLPQARRHRRPQRADLRRDRVPPLQDPAAVRDLEAEDGHRPVIAIDNTFLGPLWQKPLEHGADLVLYSLTKYVGGHSDLIAGAVLGDRERVSAVAGMRTILGTMADPNTGWLLMRSLETLKLRMTSQMKNAGYPSGSSTRTT